MGGWLGGWAGSYLGIYYSTPEKMVLQIGIPGKALKGHVVDDICTSFIGGIAPHPTTPCSLCGQSMILVTQVSE